MKAQIWLIICIIVGTLAGYLFDKYIINSCNSELPIPTLIEIPIFPTPLTVEPVSLEPIPTEEIETIKEQIEQVQAQELTAEERNRLIHEILQERRN